MLVVRTIEDAYKALEHPVVKNWFDKIPKFKTVPCDILLLVPCASAKPYTPGITRSLFYRWLWTFLERNKIRDRVFVTTISEPLAVVPENEYQEMPLYDFPPAILKKDKRLMNIYIKTVGEWIKIFLNKNMSNHKKILAYVKYGSTHWYFINYVRRKHRINVEFVVNKKDFEFIRRKHKRTWMLNWMIFLEDKLLKSIIG